MVTDSHIQDDRNGIKFYRPEGENPKVDERSILGQRVHETELKVSGALSDPLPLPEPHDIVTPHLARYRDAFRPDALQGMRIGIYQN